jgi:hypothetical protein
VDRMAALRMRIDFPAGFCLALALVSASAWGAADPARPVPYALGAKGAFRNLSFIGDSVLSFEARGVGYDGSLDEGVFLGMVGRGDLETKMRLEPDSLGGSLFLMLRADTTSSSAFVALGGKIGGNLELRVRDVAGGLVSVQTIANSFKREVRVQRSGDDFTFSWRANTSASWQSSPSILRLGLPYALMVGTAATSEDSLLYRAPTVTWRGNFPKPDSLGEAACAPRIFDFSGPQSLPALGFTSIRKASVVTGGYVAAVPDGGGRDSATFTTPDFGIERRNGPLLFGYSFSWKRDTLPKPEQYVLFATEWVDLRDRAKLHGGKVGTKGTLTIGNDARVEASLVAGGTITVRDRTLVLGDVATAKTVTLGSQSSISGRVTQNQAVSLPTLTTRTVTPGTSNRTVNPGDTLALPPGNYGDLVVYAGGRIQFTPGTYRFRYMQLEPDVRWHVQATTSDPVTVEIQGELRLGDRLKMMMRDSLGFENVSVYAGQTTDFRVGPDSRIKGYFRIPKAAATLYSRGILIDGGLYAKRITLDADGETSSLNAPARIDTVRATLAMAGASPLVLRFLPREKATATGEVSLLRGTQLLATGAFGVPTPANTWLRFEIGIIPAAGGDSILVTGQGGNGRQQLARAFVTGGVGLPQTLGIVYKTSLAHLRATAGFDSITSSCGGQACPSPLVVRQPQDAEIYFGEDAHFSAELDSVGRRAMFRWYVNGLEIAGVNGPILSLARPGYDKDSATVRARVEAVCDTFFLRTALLRVRPCGPPFFQGQPRSVHAAAGTRPKLGVIAQGLGIQIAWRRNGENIPGASGDSLLLGPLTVADDGDVYQALVTTRCGAAALSDTAVIHVTHADTCRLALSPLSDTVEDGESVRFHLRIDGCEAEEIGWLWQGQVLPGATDTALTLGPLGLSDDGSEVRAFTVDNGDTVITGPSTLTVRAPRSWSKRVAISGQLTDAYNRPIGRTGPQRVNFKALVFDHPSKGRQIYEERFEGDKAPWVLQGRFHLALGAGRGRQELERALQGVPGAWAELWADAAGTYESLGERLPLGAAPFALSAQLKTVTGHGAPTLTSPRAPVGALYLDLDTRQTWMRDASLWRRLDGTP